jgi:Tfp pilus assembly protein PilN
MPAIKINLLDKPSFEKTPLGAFLSWALSYGRYIIVCTEIVVLMAFILRFSLDRKITDLNEQINDKIAIIQANSTFETQYRILQKRFIEIGKIFATQDVSLNTLKYLETITPPGVKFESVSISENNLLISALADSNLSLSIFISNLKKSDKLTQVNLTSLNKNLTQASQITFQITSTIL